MQNINSKLLFHFCCSQHLRPSDLVLSHKNFPMAMNNLSYWTPIIPELSEEKPSTKRKSHLQRLFHLLTIGLEWGGDCKSEPEDTCPDLMYKLQETLDKCFRSSSVHHVSPELNVQTFSLIAEIPAAVDSDCITSPSNPPPMDSPILALP